MSERREKPDRNGMYTLKKKLKILNEMIELSILQEMSLLISIDFCLR